MRQPGSDFGYLEPARDFRRTASIVLVAGAIGATAAAGAVFALLGGPTVDSSLATPALTRSLEPAVTRTAAPSQAKRTTPPSLTPTQTAKVNAPQEQQSSPVGGGRPAGEATGELESSTPADSPPETPAAPLERTAGTRDSTTKAAAAPAAAGNKTGADVAQPEKKASRKPALYSRYAWRNGFFRDNGRWGGGFYRDRW
jgi:hypothetical protein